MKDGAWFPYLLVGLLLVSVGSNVYLLIRANNDPSFAVEPDYYEKAVAWDDSQAALRDSDKLGWRMDVEASRAGVSVELIDALGRPLEGAQVQVVAFHNARAAQRILAELAELSPGIYRLEQRFERPGLWEMRFVAEREGDRFLHVARTELK